MNNDELPPVLQNEVQYQDLFFYQKAEVLYALTATAPWIRWCRQLALASKTSWRGWQTA